jgi:hypothetical protein
VIVLALLASVAQPEESAKAYLQHLYANYRHSEYSPFTRPDEVFAPRLLSAIRKDEQLAHGEVGFLDGDPLCGCQDTGGMRARVGAVAARGRSATAHVSISFGPSEHRDIRLKLERTRAGWRISDVSTAEELSLLHDLEAANRKAGSR